MSGYLVSLFDAPISLIILSTVLHFKCQVELYAILNFLYPKYFTTPDKLEAAFDITKNQIDPEMLLKANKLLKLFMIRRLKDEVEKLMPKKIETKVCVL